MKRFRGYCHILQQGVIFFKAIFLGYGARCHLKLGTASTTIYKCNVTQL